jgi:hypothetical protein
MKKFLWKSGVLFAIVLFICIGIELVLLTKVNIYSYKRNYIENHLGDISVLFMGDSHIEEGVVPEEMCDSVFNFAISGRPCDIDADLLERYVPQMTNLKTIIMPITYHNFIFGRNAIATKESDNDQRSTYKCMEYKYLGLKKHGCLYWSELLNSQENLMKRLFSKNDYKKLCDSLGYVPLKIDERPENWKTRRVPAEMIANKERDSVLVDSIIGSYERITTVCKKHNVKLVFITAPLYKTYQEALSKDVLNDIDDMVSTLKKEYPNIDYYNYMFSEEFTDTDFYDSSHLSETGAIKFSKMLKGRLNN